VNEFYLGGPQDIFYARSNIVPLPLIVRAEGIRMWDDRGNAYIDVSSGPVVSNIGHGNARVAEAMAAQARTMDFAYSRVARHQPNIDLTRRIAELAGPGYERVCLASGGSEAMEIALKFLRQYVVATGHESLELLEHIRRWNRVHPESRIHIGGYDIEHDIRSTIDKVLIPYFTGNCS